jgi:hypothetical protein
MKRPNTNTRLRVLIPGAAAIVAVGLLLAGCGSSGGAKSASAAQSTAPTASSPATNAAVAAAKPATVRILSPAAGSHTGSTVTVHVLVTGGATGRSTLRYVLDGRLSRHGSTRLTYRELAPGRHTVVVSLLVDGSVRAARSFVVRAPAPPPPEPTHTEPAQPAPSTQMGSEHEASAPPAEPKPSEPKQSPPESKPSAPEGGGIPQGGGGDGDSDNNGGPSDGDGNI